MDFSVANQSPKQIWLRELCAGGRRRLREAHMLEGHRDGLWKSYVGDSHG